jgi:hypothetical protein
MLHVIVLYLGDISCCICAMLKFINVAYKMCVMSLSVTQEMYQRYRIRKIIIHIKSSRGAWPEDFYLRQIALFIWIR